MTTSELITPSHLSRKALIYIRQSSPNQTINNQESLRMQYALQQRAVELGWPEMAIEIIDRDLGTTAASADHREGFKEALAQVTLGQVGIILSFDVTRLSRNCSDWYPLLDLCGYRDCLIADRDGVYDPGSPNGRLLLGLKGQISELELHTIKARMTAGILNKAQRGDLALTLPVGFVRDALGTVHKDPNMEVQSRLRLIFATFLRLRAASQVLRAFNRDNLRVPRRDRFGDVVWRKPTVSAILSILKHPAYAGAFTYGRTRTIRTGPGPHQARQQLLSQEEWKICLKDKYPAYISWDTYEQIQVMLKDNYAQYDRNRTRGVPRPGKALLHGIVYCGACGHKMVVQYKTGTRYLCNYLRQQYGVPVCQYIPADPIDDAVVEAFFKALSPVELDAYHQVIEAKRQSDEAFDLAQRHQLQRLQYHVDLAERQFNQVDPANRLVAAELERRWENALRELRTAQETYDHARSHDTAAAALSAELKSAFEAIGQQLPDLWHQGLMAQSQKKALLRCLIDKVVIHRSQRDTVQTRIVWKGGDVTAMDLSITVGSWSELSNSAELAQQILDMHHQGLDDATIAQRLTAQGYRSPLNRTKLLTSTVKGVRLKHRVFVTRSQSHPRRIAGYLTVPQAAAALDISPYWFYDRIKKGVIVMNQDPSTRLYLFPDAPETLDQFRHLQAGHVNRLSFESPPAHEPETKNRTQQQTKHDKMQ
jgi:DNA invertase Pin-like site-specific DNA recombinase